MDEELQNEEYQNDIFAEKFFDPRDVGAVPAKREPDTTDQEYVNDNQEYEYIKFSDVQMRELPEVPTEHRQRVLVAFKSGQWRDLCRGPFIAFAFLMSLSLILAIAALVLACLKCFAECPKGWKKLGEKCYNFSSETKKWNEAQKHCQNVGAYLVVIKNEREREFMDYKMGKAYWIGLFYEEDKRAWKWVNDKNEFYSNWDRDVVPQKGEAGHGQNCVVSKADKLRKWKNIECQYRHSFICEKHRHVACVLESSVLQFRK